MTTEPQQVPGEVTRLLHRVEAGDRSAVEKLAPLVYHELRAIASANMRSERSEHTLSPTALVNEAWMRLTGGESAEWKDRKHFYRAAAIAMRCILVDAARRKARHKRGNNAKRLPLDDALFTFEDRSFDLLALDDVLDRLGEFAPRQADLVQLRFFAGLTTEQAANILGVSSRTVSYEWRAARAWLLRELVAE